MSRYINIYLPIVFGGLIYLFLRDDSILLNQILRPQIHFIDLPIKHSLPNWFVFSLPDGLFVYSYVFFILDNWKGELNYLSISFSLFLPIILILIEFGQRSEIFSGTFDKLDLLFYILGVILSFTTSKGIKIWQKKKCP